MQGDWRGWLLYFLEGVASQAEDAISRIYRINTLLDDWRKKTAGLSTSLPHQLIDVLVANPFLTITQSAENMGGSYTRMQRAVDKLEELAIVREISGSKRNRVYCAEDILKIIKEPTKIAP